MAFLDRSAADVGALLGGFPLKDSKYKAKAGNVMTEADSPSQKNRETADDAGGICANPHE
ncbi:hypothetical protein ANRL1_00323 [Anaerolineae bacterium]|nr:hypothetical protein ANRL1_00323 [Anaerolineae bacterium]